MAQPNQVGNGKFLDYRFSPFSTALFGGCVPVAKNVSFVGTLLLAKGNGISAEHMCTFIVHATVHFSVYTMTNRVIEFA